MTYIESTPNRRLASPLREVVRSDRLILTRHAAGRTGVRVTELAGPGEKSTAYIGSGATDITFEEKSEILDPNNFAIKLSGNAWQMRSFHRERINLTSMMQSGAEGDDEEKDALKKARAEQARIIDGIKAEAIADWTADLGPMILWSLVGNRRLED